MHNQEQYSSDEEPDLTGTCVGKQKKNGPQIRTPSTDWIYTKHDWEYLFPRWEQAYSKKGNPKGSVLDVYWPVYVNGFFVHSTDQNDWYDEVASYFASFGLLIRMVYFHEADKEYFEFQQTYQVLDMLVYFLSKAEAKNAIKVCHRQLRYGYRMNATCGRVRMNFAKKRSALFDENSHQDSESDRSLSEFLQYPAEFNADYIFQFFGAVEFVTRFSSRVFAVQFKSNLDMANALRSQIKFIPLKRFDLGTQRFIEGDVINQLKNLIQTDPHFMNMIPKPHIMQFFLRGERPIINQPWKDIRQPIRSQYGLILKSSRHKDNWMRMQRKNTELIKVLIAQENAESEPNAEAKRPDSAASLKSKIENLSADEKSSSIQELVLLQQMAIKEQFLKVKDLTPEMKKKLEALKQKDEQDLQAKKLEHIKEKINAINKFLLGFSPTNYEYICKCQEAYKKHKDNDKFSPLPIPKTKNPDFMEKKLKHQLKHLLKMKPASLEMIECRNKSQQCNADIEKPAENVKQSVENMETNSDIVSVN